MEIQHDLNFRTIKPVFLNRNGVKIGEIAVWESAYPKLVYLSHRRWRPSGGHYFILHHGFGIDSALLKDLICKHNIETIIICYDGVRGRRYFVSNIDDWIDNGIDVAYTKDFEDNEMQTYGKQKILPTKFMKELVVRIK